MTKQCIGVSRVFLRVIALALLTSATGCLGIGEGSGTTEISVQAAAAPGLSATDNSSHQIGVAHFRKREFGLAENAFRKAIAHDPRATRSWIGLAASYDRLQRFDMADKAYRKALGLEPESSVVWNNLGYSYLLRGDIPRAGRALKRAHSLDNDNPQIQNNINLLFVARQKQVNKQDG